MMSNPSTATVGRDEIALGLGRLGLSEGGTVGVHSSLSSFGHVEGGADAVIDALLAAVGASGSVAMPAYSNNRQDVPKTPEEDAAGMVTWKARLTPFDPQSHGTWTGRIADVFWRRSGVLRGLHPTHSIAATGPHAAQLITGWRALHELDGHILLLGVTTASCTSLHLAEQYVALPEFILRRLRKPAWFLQQYPPELWDVGYGPYPDFVLMEGPCQHRGIMRIEKIGNAVVRLVRLRELVDLYASLLRRCPEVFYHGCVPDASGAVGEVGETLRPYLAQQSFLPYGC